MDENKFDKIMNAWASAERDAAPRLRPTPEMYQMVTARKPRLFFPVFARWVTVGVAVAAILVIAALHPRLFAPEKFFQAPQEQRAEPQRQPAPAASSDKDGEQKQQLVVEDAMHSAPLRDDVGNEGLAVKEEPFMEASQDVSKRDALPGASVFPETRVLREAELLPPLPVPAVAPPAHEKSLSAPRRMKTFPIQTLSASKPDITADADGELPAEGIERGMTDETFTIKTFREVDGVWIDTAHSDLNKMLTIQRDSPAYHDLLAALPVLRQFVEDRPRVIVALGQQHSVEMAVNTGQTRLTPEELTRLVHAYHHAHIAR